LNKEASKDYYKVHRIEISLLYSFLYNIMVALRAKNNKLQ